MQRIKYFIHEKRGCNLISQLTIGFQNIILIYDFFSFVQLQRKGDADGSSQPRFLSFSIHKSCQWQPAFCLGMGFLRSNTVETCQINLFKVVSYAQFTIYICQIFHIIVFSFLHFYLSFSGHRMYSKQLQLIFLLQMI